MAVVICNAQAWSGLPSAEEVGIKFAAKNHITGTDANALDALRALPAATVTDGLNMMDMNNPTYSGPFIDGKLVTAEPQDIYHAGVGMNMPLLVGATDMDIGFPPVVKTLAGSTGPGSACFPQAATAYDPNNAHGPQDVAQMLASDQMMVEPARFAARMWPPHKGSYAGVYRFAYVADSMKKEVAGRVTRYRNSVCFLIPCRRAMPIH